MTENNAAVMAAEPYVLVPPEVVAPMPASHLEGTVPLPADMQVKAEVQVDRCIDTLINEDLSGEEFKSVLEEIASIGRDEIAETIELADRIAAKNASVVDDAGYQALEKIRAMFDELNPASQGDLRAPGKLLGIAIPFGNKLSKYVRRCQSAASQMAAIQSDFRSAETSTTAQIEEMGGARSQLWAALERLEAAICFSGLLEEKLTARHAALQTDDAGRAGVLERDVLSSTRQAQNAIQTAQSLAFSVYNVLGELRKARTEAMNGYERVTALAGGALSLPAIANGFAENQAGGLQELQALFDSCFEAMDLAENYHANSLATAQQNARMLTEEVVKARNRVGNEAA
ncbi:hypothetical protein BH11PSE11_BH11PSE11_14850 [soil metagenome]